MVEKNQKRSSLQCPCALPGAKATLLLEGWVLQPCLLQALLSCGFIPSRGSTGNRNNSKATHPHGILLHWEQATPSSTGKNPMNLSPAPVPTQDRAVGSFGFFCKGCSSKVLVLFAPHPHREADREHEKPRALAAVHGETPQANPCGTIHFKECG